MGAYSVIGLFCEDVRREHSGQETIIGTLPDTIRLSDVPGVLSRLGVYIRAMFDVNFELKELSYELKSPDNDSIQSIEMDNETKEKAFSMAKGKNNPIVGFKTVSVFSPIQIPSEGHFEIWATVNKDTFLCGILKIEVAQKENEDETSVG